MKEQDILENDFFKMEKKSDKKSKSKSKNKSKNKSKSKGNENEKLNEKTEKKKINEKNEKKRRNRRLLRQKNYDRDTKSITVNYNSKTVYVGTKHVDKDDDHYLDTFIVDDHDFDYYDYDSDITHDECCGDDWDCTCCYCMFHKSHRILQNNEWVKKTNSNCIQIDNEWYGLSPSGELLYINYVKTSY